MAALLGSGTVPDQTAPTVDGDAGRLAAGLREAGKAVTPGWLGVDVHRLVTPLPRLGAQPPADGSMLLHIGVGWLSEEEWFPVVVPLLGAGHLTVDGNLRSAKPAHLVRAVLLRLLGSMPPELLDVRLVDGATAGAAFSPFAPLMKAEILTAPIIDAAGLSQVLDDAEEHVRLAQRAAAEGHLEDVHYMVIVGQVPEARTDLARIIALAHAGPAARLHFVLAGWPGPGLDVPLLDHAVHCTVDTTDERYAHLSGPPGKALFSAYGRGLAARVTLDDDPNPVVIEAVCQALTGTARMAAGFTFEDLVSEKLWQESSITGLRTPLGRAGRDLVDVAFDDRTPHWLLTGRSGSGKTSLQFAVLYGLAARYSPDELALYLLDFKEGVSFSEFAPTDLDPSWIPHARAVGIESDREYGIAVLRELDTEMTRRSGLMKRAGATTVPELRAARPDLPVPRIVAVIDEFQVLLQGDPRLSRLAVELLENLARKGRSYGIHLVLASQTLKGIDALATKRDSIFGQFALRIALAGGGDILEPGNTAADGLQVGSAAVNDSAGLTGRDRIVRFPDVQAAKAAVTDLRSRLWEMRPKGAQPPAVFAGYAEAHIDPILSTLSATGRRRRLLIGKAVDVTGSIAAFDLDATPGRHLAVLGTSKIGADILHATVTALARQHLPGSVHFILAPLVADADDLVTDLLEELRATGHRHTEIGAAAVPATLAGLAADGEDTYLVLFGGDAASPLLAVRNPETRREGVEDLRAVLANGPTRGVHVLGWWRGTRRFTDDIGGSGGRDAVACLVGLNVSGDDLATITGDHTINWTPRANRALLLDRHHGTTTLAVPFVRPGRYDDGTAS